MTEEHKLPGQLCYYNSSCSFLCLLPTVIGECGCCSDSCSAAAAITADHTQKFCQSSGLQLLLFLRNFGKLPDMLQTIRRTCLFFRYVHSQIILQNLCQFILHYMCRRLISELQPLLIACWINSCAD